MYSDLKQLFENAGIEIENNLLAEATIANEDTHNKIMKLGAIHNSTMYDDYYTLKNGRRIRLSTHDAFHTRSNLNVEYGGSKTGSKTDISDEELKRINDMPEVEFKPNFTHLVINGDFKNLDLSDLSNGQLKTLICSSQVDYTDVWVEAYKRGIIDKETYEKPILNLLNDANNGLRSSKRMRNGNEHKQRDIQFFENKIKRLQELLNIKDAPIVKTFKLEETIQNLPNENSLGEKIIPDDDPIKLQNFWNWFGDSKVVDEQGRPLVVYHGTPNDFNSFSTSKIGTSGTSLGMGFNFVSSKDYAEGYSKGKTPLNIYLNLKNPLRFSSKGKITQKEITKIIELFKKRYITKESLKYSEQYMESIYDIREKNDSRVLDAVLNSLLPFYEGDGDGYLDIRNIEIEVTGIDGYKFISQNNDIIFIAFVPNQIKSINNTGTFSSASNNIYEATAYHGTPHSFNEFSLKHISSGEGHQVHGWGLYFSLDKEIASNYRTILGTKKNNKLEDWQDKLLYEIRINGFDTVEFDLKYALKRAMESEDYPEKEADIEFFKKQLAFAESLVDVNGTLFTVDVPENDVLLDEHASLSNQPSMVQQVIKESMVEIYGKYLKKFDYKIKEDIEDKICEYVDADDSLSKDDKWHINYIIQKMFSIDVISEEEPITPEELKDKWLKTIQTFVDSKKHVLDYAKERNDDEAIEKYSKDIMRAEYFRSLIPDIMKLITNQNGDLIFFKEDMKRFINEETGKSFYGHLAAYLEANMSMKTSQTISRYCLASMWLLKQGVQGIKYHGGLDGDCVVIFNPKRVKIIGKE